MFVLAAIAAALAIAQSQGQAKTEEELGGVQKDALHRDKRFAKNQAKALEQRANLEAAASQRAAIDQRRLGRYVSGRARAAAGASGVTSDSPSVNQVIGDIDFEAELRALSIKHQGATAEQDIRYQAYLARNQADYLDYQGELTTAFADARATQTRLAGFGSALGSGASAAGGASYSPASSQSSNYGASGMAAGGSNVYGASAMQANSNNSTLYSKYG